MRTITPKRTNSPRMVQGLSVDNGISWTGCFNIDTNRSNRSRDLIGSLMSILSRFFGTSIARIAGFFEGVSLDTTLSTGAGAGSNIPCLISTNLIPRMTIKTADTIPIAFAVEVSSRFRNDDSSVPPKR